MISRTDRLVHIEAFELCTLNKSVVTTRARLHRPFPGLAVGLSNDTFNQSYLQATIAYTLTKIIYRPVIDTKSKARKAGQLHDENRNTTHPEMVTELFMGFLGAIGEPVNIKYNGFFLRRTISCIEEIV